MKTNTNRIAAQLLVIVISYVIELVTFAFRRFPVITTLYFAHLLFWVVLFVKALNGTLPR